MRRPALALLVMGALALAGASSSCAASEGPTFPLGAQPLPASFADLSVTGLPAACSGQVYYEASTSLCPPGLTYFLCDRSSYTEFDCSDPGTGWSAETLSQYDRVASDPSACGSTEASPSGTVYVESSILAPGQNAILAFHYCGGTLPTVLVGRYSTGGSGAADLYDRGILDADQQLTLNADATLLFAVNQGSDSIAAFHVGSDGVLTSVAGSPFASGGPAPASIGVSGDVLVVANKASDGVRDLGDAAPSYATFRIASDGSLSPLSKFELRARASPTQAFVAPGGALVFGTEETGVLRSFALSPDGRLTQSPGSPLALASSLFPNGRPNPVWPAGLSASPTEHILYTGIPNNNSIAAFDFAATGELTLVGGEDDPLTAHPSLPCWSVVSADGTRLYFANAGSDNVSVWDTATDPRHPRLLQTFELTGGGNPWGLRIDPTGQLLFVITPRQIHQVPLGQGQLLHALQFASDGTIVDEIAGSPVQIPAPPGTNVYGVALVARPGR